MPGIKPLPHIPGVEITGIIEKVGNHVTALNEGDKVVVITSYLMVHAICVLMDMKCFAETLEY